jgi:hypothetical protein
MLIARQTAPGKIRLQNTGQSDISEIRSMPPGFYYRSLAAGEAVEASTSIRILRLRYVDVTKATNVIEVT